MTMILYKKKTKVFYGNVDENELAREERKRARQGNRNPMYKGNYCVIATIITNSCNHQMIGNERFIPLP